MSTLHLSWCVDLALAKRHPRSHHSPAMKRALIIGITGQDGAYPGEMLLQQEVPDDFVIATGEQYGVRDFVGMAAREAVLTPALGRRLRR